MRVAIIGANGQLGRDAWAAFERAGHQVLPLTHADLEVADLDAVQRVLGRLRPGLVLNTAAFHHLDRCEEQAGRAYEVNAVGPRNLAIYAREHDAVLMQVSTDHVFSGAKRAPYLEHDMPGPLNVYGNTKLAGELFIQGTLERAFILRTSALYGRSLCRGKGPNFVERMLQVARERGRVSVVDGERLTPTSTRELAAQMVRLAGTERFGLYHATAEGDCSWHEFAQAIFELAAVPATLSLAAPGEFKVKVRRPAYSVLENGKLADETLSLFRPWQEGLREYLGAA